MNYERFDAMINSADMTISSGQDVSYWGLKLEKGVEATEWSPAPEDSEE